MPFPHPYSRKDHCRNEDKPCRGSIVWNLVERTINVTEDGNAEDEVNPAKNGTCEASAHDVGWLGHGVTPRILTFGFCFFPVSPVKVLAERYFREIASWRKERARMGGPAFTAFASPSAANQGSQRRTAWRTRRAIAESRVSSWRRGRRGVQGDDRREGDRAHRNRCATRQHPWR